MMAWVLLGKERKQGGLLDANQFKGPLLEATREGRRRAKGGQGGLERWEGSLRVPYDLL